MKQNCYTVSLAVLMLIAVVFSGSIAYAANPPLCPHVIGWSGAINTWCQGAPYIKVIFASDLSQAIATGAKVIYRPWDADSSLHDDDCLPSSYNGTTFADMVWAKISGLGTKPFGVTYRNEFNWTSPTASQRTCDEFINYYNRLRADGYTGQIIFSSFGVGWVDAAVWQDSHLVAAVNKADAVEVHEYFDTTVNCLAPYLCFRLRDIALANNSYLQSKTFYIGEFGAAKLCQLTGSCGDPSCRDGWQDNGKLSASAYETQMGIYRAGSPDQVAAIFVFQQGSSSWATYETMNTDVATYMKNTWTASTGSLTGNVKSSGGSNLTGATVSLSPGGATGNTNSSGNYSISALSAGSYTATCSLSGYNSSSSGITITNGQQTTKNFTLTPLVSSGTISGTVTDSSGVAISGAAVFTNTGGYSATTASNGTYTMSGVTPGSYNVTAIATYYITATNSNVSVSSGNTSTSNFALSSSGMNGNTPTGTNACLTYSSYSTNSQYSGSFTGANALDGSLTTKWCSDGTTAVNWIAVDLGANKTVNGFIIQNAGAGGENTVENLKFYGVQSATSMSGPWTDEVDVNNSAQANTTNLSYSTPKSLRYVRLYITNDGADNYARLYEFQVLCAQGTGTGTLAGTVVDGSGNGLPSATVYTNTGGYQATTNSSGAYTISGVAPGTYEVTVSVTGFITSTDSGETVTSGNTTTANFNIAANSMNSDTPTGTNMALGATYSDDSEYSTSFKGCNALDGSLSTKWCTTNSTQTHWLAVDLGSYQTVNGYILQLAGAGGEYTTDNLIGYAIQSGTSLSGPWIDEVEQGNTAQASTVGNSYITPKSLRYIRLHVTNDGIDNYCRLYEFQILCQTASGTGTISGTAVDGSGNVLPGATVATTTGGYSTTTNSSGGYTLSNVTAGTYTVTAALAGFATGSNSSVTVTSGNTTTSNFTLTPNGTNSNTPSGTNLALSCSYSDDSEYNSSTTGAKALDGSTSTKWCTTSTSSTHWLAVDLGATKTINGYILDNASIGGEYTYYNTKNFAIQTGSSLTGPWQDDAEVNNSAQAGACNVTYTTPKQARYVRLRITNSGIDNYARIYEFQVLGSGSGWSGVTENFDSLPTFSSTYDASWGSSATWSDITGGQSGNCLQVARSSQGSSVKTLVYTVPQNTTVTVSVYMKCPNYTGGAYWMESACKLGNNSAQDFDSNSGTWTYIQKFGDTGTNGNSNAWTQYSTTISTGSNTQITIGYKLGSTGCTGPTVYWDTFYMHS